jgi:hypothetical protein
MERRRSEEGSGGIFDQDIDLAQLVLTFGLAASIAYLIMKLDLLDSLETGGVAMVAVFLAKGIHQVVKEEGVSTFLLPTETK